MKSIIRLLIGLIILLALIFIVGFFLPKSLTVTSQANIKASPQIVFEQVNVPRNWELWSPWVNMDTSLIMTFAGPEEGVGASYSWKSSKFSNGKWTVKASDPYKYIESEMDFGEQGKSKGWWKFQPDNEGTLVTWGIENDNMGYAERYFALLMKKNMIETLDGGLDTLKKVCEKLRFDRISKIQEVKLLERMAITYTDSSTIGSMDTVIKNMFEKLNNHISKYEIETSDNPFVIYHSYDSAGYSKIEAVIPVAKKIYYTPKGIEFKVFPESDALLVNHWGILNTVKARKALDKYIQENNITETGPVWEVELVGPSVEKDTTKWHIQVYTILKENKQE